jgi:hypothetical protein
VADWPEVELENEHLRIRFLPAKGADIVELTDRRTGIDLLFKMQPSREDYEELHAGAGTFPDWYAGGWQELLPNGDLLCCYQGIEHEHAGETWRRAWEFQHGTRWVELEVVLRTLPLRLSKRIDLDAHRPLLRFSETLENLSDAPVELVWGHHPAFGPPFLGPDCYLDVPPCRVEVVDLDSTSRLQPGPSYSWPRLPTREGGWLDVSRIGRPEDRTHELCLLHQLSAGWLALRNTSLELGFALRFDRHLFRWLWFWMDYGGGDEDPWRGLYAIAVEPFTGTRSLADSAARGETLKLPPFGRVSTSLEASTFLPSGPVQDVRPGGVITVEA